jgi:PAS domain S-box-containing protein
VYHLLTEAGRPYPSELLPLARAVRGETVIEERWRIARPDGTEVLAVGSAKPLIDADGRQTGAILTARDETERDRVEQQVRENEARLRALTDNLPNGAVYQIWTSADGAERKFLYLSQSYERLSGVAVDRVLADPGLAYDAVHPDDRQKLVDAEREAIESKKLFDVQARFCRTDGEILWCRFISAPREQADGSIIWDGLQIDATARIRAQLALRDLNETLQQRVADLAAERDRIWKVSKDLFVVVGFDGLYRTANPAWHGLLGYDPDDLVGTRFDELVHPDDVAAAQRGFEELASGKVIENFDVRLRAADGSYRWLSWTCVPEGDQFYASGRDVHERKELEAQLRQSQKMEAVGQLTGGIAHDFNNLLTIIRSAVDLMRRRDLPDERRVRYVDAISDTVDRASKLTGQLLAFARRQPLKPQVIDIADHVRSIADLIKPLLGSRISVQLQIDSEPRFVEVDLNQFENALVNLALNGRDAISGEGVLTITVADSSVIPAFGGHAAREGNFVAVTVADTGSGIPADILNQIFEPFFTTKEVGKGTGLGLSQVYGFVHQSGGGIEVASDLDRGSQFTIYLPRVSATPQADETEPEQLPRSTAQRGHILLVEDNQQVGQFSAEMLHDLGYETTLAADAREALVALSNDDLRYDVVFTDVIMPGMNGLELAQAVRERHPGLPVVLTSGYSDVLAKEGSYGFELLRKPYSVEALSRVLRKAIHGAGRAG